MFPFPELPELNHVKNDRLIKGLTDIDNNFQLFCDPEKIEVQKKQLEVIDSIFNVNIETVDETFHNIQDFGKESIFFINCICYALEIRPKQTDSLVELLSKLSNIVKIPYNFFTKKKLGFFISKKTIRIEESVLERYKDLIDVNQSSRFFDDNTIEKAIEDDDVEALIKFSAAACFEPQSMIIIGQEKPIYNVIGDLNDKLDYGFGNEKLAVTYMQIMAFNGSIKCFKYALLDGSFIQKDLEIYAVAGGNFEIVRLLEQNGSSFNEMFRCALKFHRDEIADWLLENYICEEIELCDAIRYCNVRSLYFLYANKINTIQDVIDFGLDEAAHVNSYILIDYFISYCKAYTDGSTIVTVFHQACKSGNIDIIKYIIEYFHLDVNTTDRRGKTALFLVTKRRYTEIVKFLVEEAHADVNVIDNNNRTAIFYAGKHKSWDLVKYLLEVGHADTNIKDINSESLMSTIIELDDIEKVKYIVEKSNYDPKNENASDLFAAIKIGNIEIFKYLVSKGANIHQKGYKGMNLLHCATREENLEFIKILVEMGIDVNEINSDDKENNSPLGKFFQDGVNLTPLHIAVENNNFEIVRYLIEKCGASGNIRDGKGRTPLNIAASLDLSSDFIIYLTKNCKESINIYDLMSKTPLSHYIERDDEDFVKYMLYECHSDISYLDIQSAEGNIEKILNECKLPFEAVKNGNIEDFKKLFEKGFYIEQKYNHKTALQYACKRGNLEFVKYLIEECNADIEAKESLFFTTPLKYACIKGHLDIAKYLIEECHANINTKDSLNRGILISATNSENLELVKYLVEECHLKVEDEDFDNKKNIFITGHPLFIAAEHSSIETIKFYIEVCGVDPNIKDREEKTLLHVACLNEDSELFNYLISKYNLDVTAKTCKGKTLLHYACKGGNFELVKRLINEFHLDPREKSIEGVTTLMEACCSNNIELIKYLVEERNIDPEIIAKEHIVDQVIKSSCIINAVKTNNMDIIKYLIQERHISSRESDFLFCYPNVTPFIKQIIALHKEVFQQNIQMIKKLVEQDHIYPNYCFNGVTPLGLAQQIENKEIIDYLTEKIKNC